VAAENRVYVRCHPSDHLHPPWEPQPKRDLRYLCRRKAQRILFKEDKSDAGNLTCAVTEVGQEHRGVPELQSTQQALQDSPAMRFRGWEAACFFRHSVAHWLLLYNDTAPVRAWRPIPYVHLYILTFILFKLGCSFSRICDPVLQQVQSSIRQNL